MRRKGHRRDIAQIREFVASEHERTILEWATRLGGEDSPQAVSSRKYAAACRAGEPVLLHWYALPEGTLALPRAPGGPCDCYVITREGTIIPEEEYDAMKKCAATK